MDADASEITTIGSVAVLIARALHASGCEPAPLFQTAGIDFEEMANPAARIPMSRLQALWSLAVETTGDQCFGLRAAEQLQPVMLHGLGFAWLASDSLRDALNRLVRYSRLINTAIAVRLEDWETTVELVVTGPEKWPGFVYAASDAGMAIFLKMCRITAGEGVTPASVVLQRPQPPCATEFERVFAAPVGYGAAANRLCFDRQLVDTWLPTANPELARVNDQTVVDYLARFDRESITMRVRSRIIERLPDGRPSQESIASSLHVSLRSLQRKLRDEEVTFKMLLENTRRELAMQYVRESHRTISEITYLLGFSEPGNFTRAFKRWTGMPPGEFRKGA